MKTLLSILTRTLVLLPCLGCAQFGGPNELPEGVEAFSLHGEALRPPEVAPERLAVLEANLGKARARHEELGDDEMAAIWHGRRLGYLGRYREAVAIYDAAIGEHPTSFRLLRHRGHRALSLREFELAVADLGAASLLSRKVPDQYEEDGAPNRYGIPRSTTHSNIEYHLGLAHYLLGQYEEALEVYERCQFFSRVNDDMLVATLYWNVLTLWKLGRETQANELLEEVSVEMDILENDGYHRLLLLFKGQLEEADLVSEGAEADIVGATVGYGLGAWHAHHGRESEARAVFESVLADTPWAAFGHIAAEVELTR